MDADAEAHFWYSRKLVPVALCVLFVLIEVTSRLIPPFQSPDEAAHIARAYLLSKGEVFLGAPNGYTGGRIDTGLLAYMSAFGPIILTYEQKVTQEMVRSSERISWSGTRKFMELSNAAVNFPLPYLPQATALFLSELFRMRVADGYYLARTFSLVATLGLLYAAAVLYPMPLVVVVLFLMPMSLFQLGSASLDSVTFALIALVGSLVMRGSDARFSFNVWMHVALAVCVLALVTSRENMVALALAPSILYRVRGRRLYLASSIACLGAALAWAIFISVTVKGLSVGSANTQLEIVEYYLTHPGSLPVLFLNTVGNLSILKFYWDMIVGVLGWLDTPLDRAVYVTVGIVLGALAAMSFNRGRFQSPVNLGSVFLCCAALVSFGLLFLIAALCWTPIPADAIVAIQGRYFIPLFILLGYSFLDRMLSPGEMRMVGFAISYAVIISSTDMTEKLITRYWLG